MKANASFFSAPYSFTTPLNNAAYAVWSGTSNLGLINGQGVSQSGIQYLPSGAPVFGTAPNGLYGIQLKLEGHYASTTLQTGTWDAIFDRGFAGDFTAVSDFATGKFYEWGQSTIEGGSGQFEGATGKVDLIQEGKIQVNIDGSTQTPAGNNGTFGFAKGTFTYNVTLPGVGGLFTSVAKAKDQFVVDSITGAAAGARIAKFEKAYDSIILSNPIFNPSGTYTRISPDIAAAPSSMHFVSAYTKPIALTSRSTILYERATGNISFDRDGTGPLAAVGFANLVGAPVIAATNFLFGN